MTAVPVAALMSMPLWVRQSPSVSFLTSMSPLKGVMAAPLTGSVNEKSSEDCCCSGSADASADSPAEDEDSDCTEGCDTCVEESSCSPASALICCFML